MRVTNVAVSEVEEGARIGAAVEWDHPRRGPDQLSFIYRGVSADALITPGDAVAATAFMPAMAQREDITVEAPVSRRLCEGMDRVADIWTKWMPRWRRPEVTAQAVDRSDMRPRRTAACFSAGVDSYFTVLRPREETIDLLLTMLGFAHPALVATGRLSTAMVQIAAAADRLGIEHVIVDSNAYVFCARYMPAHSRYMDMQQGAVLAALGLGLGSMIRKLFIASSFSWRGNRRPWGTHVDVDPLWSTEATEIVHDGFECTRQEKIAFVARSDVAMETLRVCRQMESAEGNCGKCDKCRQTALTLTVEGAIDRCLTLDRVSPGELRKTLILERHLEGARRVRDRLDDAELKAAMTTAIRRSQVRRLVRPFGRALRKVGLR